VAFWKLVSPSFLKSRHKASNEPSWAAHLRRELHESKILSAQCLSEQLRARGRLPRLADAEFKVFSQFGEDGILQYLVNRLEVRPHSFIEFGVDSYREANTRLLLQKDNWRGLIMDGNAKELLSIEREKFYWRHELTVAAAFITRDNIDSLFKANGFQGRVGVLSIDIDGNDYWVWERITSVEPVIVVAEYNSVFGAEKAVSVPYDPQFQRSAAHHSNLYFGCSLAALCHLAEKKGLAFVGSNSAGNNAFFVDRRHLGDLQPLTSEAGYVESRFRESRDEDGRLNLLSGLARRVPIADMPLIDVITGRTISVRDL